MRSFSLAFLFYVFFSFGFTESSYANTCFTAADDARLQFDVFQNAPPSHMDSADWPYYPASGAASAQITALNTTAQQLKLFYWQWANHGTRAVAKGNLAPGVADVTKTVVNFSTIDKANACTLAQTAFALGKSNYGNGVAARHGLQVTSVVPTNPSMTDVCIVPGQMLSPNVGGILLDYEVQDGRTALQTKNFLIAWASMVHGAGRKAFLYANPLDAPTQALTGISSKDGPEILAAFDLISILLWHGNLQQDINQSFLSQMKVIRGLGQVDPHKILLTFELANTALTDAQIVRNLIAEYNFLGVMFWRDGAQQGGLCSSDVNQKIGTIAFGSPPR